MNTKLVYTDDWFLRIGSEGNKTLFNIARERVFDRLSKYDPAVASAGEVPEDAVRGVLEELTDVSWRLFRTSIAHILDEKGPLVLCGSVGRWDGKRPFAVPVREFREICDFLEDCGAITVEEDDRGDLVITGVHHDGRNVARLRGLNEAGREWLDDRDDGGDTVFDEGAHTEPLHYVDRFGGMPEINASNAKPWFVKEARREDPEGFWELADLEDVDLHPQMADVFRQAAETNSVDLSVVGYAESDERYEVLAAVVSRLSPDGKWSSRLKALGDAFDRIERGMPMTVRHMKVDNDHQVMYVILGIDDSPVKVDIPMESTEAGTEN